MKKILLSLFALGAMFTFVTPACAQFENEDGSYTYYLREQGQEGGVSADFTITRLYEEDSDYYYFYKVLSSKDYMLRVSSTNGFSAYDNWGFYIYADNTVTFECLDEDYVISSIEFYPYAYGEFNISDEAGNKVAVSGKSTGSYSSYVSYTDINASTCKLTIDGDGKTGFYYIDFDNDELYGGITVVEASSVSNGIKDVQAKKQNDGRIFDVQGREVLNPTKGLYIQNGKKFMVK